MAVFQTNIQEEVVLSGILSQLYDQHGNKKLKNVPGGNLKIQALNSFGFPASGNTTVGQLRRTYNENFKVYRQTGIYLEDAVGHYYEFAFAKGILSAATSNGIYIHGMPQMDGNALNLIAAAAPGSPLQTYASNLIAEAKMYGEEDGKLFFEEYKEQIKGNFSELITYGASQSIGDIGLKIGNQTIIIECKYLVERSTENYHSQQVHIFELSDGVYGNFKLSFREFLRDHPSREYWYHGRVFYRPSDWFKNRVMSKGFREFALETSDSTTLAETFSYFLQKAGVNTMHKQKNIQERRMIYRVKPNINGNTTVYSLSIKPVSLQEIQEKIIADFSFGYGKAGELIPMIRYFDGEADYKNEQSIGQFRIKSKSSATIEAASHQKGKWESTSFDFSVDKLLFSRYNSYKQ